MPATKSKLIMHSRGVKPVTSDSLDILSGQREDHYTNWAKRATISRLVLIWSSVVYIEVGRTLTVRVPVTGIWQVHTGGRCEQVMQVTCRYYLKRKVVTGAKSKRKLTLH